MKRMSASKQRQYAADVEADFSGRPQPYGTYDQEAEDKADAEQGDGTEASGYVTPELGPFRCDNCTHFQSQQLTVDSRQSEEGEGQGAAIIRW